MTRDAVSEFPELSRVFSGYLHEDLAAEYGSPDAALVAFRDDASPAEWHRFQREARRLAMLAADGSFDDLCALVQRLGSHWTPPSREALIALLTRAADMKPSSPT
jgi:hypothetical protein